MRWTKVKDLTPQAHSFNIKLIVLDKLDAQQRPVLSPNVCTAYVADDSGSVFMPLVADVAKHVLPSDIICLYNAYEIALTTTQLTPQIM